MDRSGTTGQLGKVGIIANPVAQSGAAAEAANKFADMLASKIGASNCELLLTEHAGHAVQIAEDKAHACDTLMVIGGDGIVHEVANGVMRLPREARPKFGVVPVGSGNDYALTLGMSHDLHEACRQLLECNVRHYDVGCVNGEYFVETLSFGLDAAIALDTVQRRKKTGRHGTILYMESGFDQILNHRDPLNYQAELYGVPAFEGALPLHIQGKSLTFAVQIGKTYGGHFKICPEASPDDGLFDICIAHGPLGVLRSVVVFLKAKGGHHVNSKVFEFHKCKGITVQFEQQPPCQADGEAIMATHFEVTTCAGALDVLVGSKDQQ